MLLNIGGEPTYFMSLKDSSDLVKMYAMVNVSQYQIVATGVTVAACESNYLSLLQQHGISVNVNEDSEIIIDQSNISGTVAEIRTAVLDGNSWYYIRLEGSEVFYAISATADRNVVILNVGDAVTIQVSPDATGSILDASSISVGGANPAQPAPEPTTTPQEDGADAPAEE